MPPSQSIDELREQILRLQQSIDQKSMVSTGPPPFGVPPASASELPSGSLLMSSSSSSSSASSAPESLFSSVDQLMMMSPTTTTTATTNTAAHAAAADGSLLSLHGDYHSVLDTVGGFSAIADAGSDIGGAFAVLLLAAGGALGLEYVATNKTPPIPDPLLGGVWSALHSAAKTVSKPVGAVLLVAVNSAKERLP